MDEGDSTGDESDDLDLSIADPDLDLLNPGATALIRLTNRQFRFWAEIIGQESAKVAPEAPPPKDPMALWFILSNLALHPEKDFSVTKKHTYTSIPGLKDEAVRKHVAIAQGLGLVE